MAGDWIKMEHATPDKPEIFRMSLDLGITPEHVLGCLMRVWVWADVQTLDGNAVCVTGVTLDRIACHAGISQALRKVGWLTGDDGQLNFTNFERHNGETAKTRALSAKRQDKYRKSKAESNGNNVTEVTQTPLRSNDSQVTREEKRREEKRREESKTTPAPVGAPASGDAEFVEGLNLPAWERWVSYRKEIRKPLKPASISAAMKDLAGYGSDQPAVVDRSIANGWQGLFPLNGSGKHSQAGGKVIGGINLSGANVL